MKYFSFNLLRAFTIDPYLHRSHHKSSCESVNGQECNVYIFIYEINTSNYFYTRSLFSTANEMALQTAN